MEGFLQSLENRFKGSVKDFLVKRIKNEKKIFIADTTLRDGEQAPGAAMNMSEKLQVAKQLELLGVDSIEAGFPISSKEEFEAVRLIAQKIKGPVITALCRAKRDDIDCAREALKDARRWALALFLGTSPILRKHALKKSKDEILQSVRDAIVYAKRFTDSVAFGAEDASRTEPEFLYTVYREAIDAGAMVVGFTDTVGCMTPDEVSDTISNIRANVGNLNNAFLAVHFHNDLGLAVANTLAAIKSGVNIVQCTINGIGERAGNTSLEEIVMALTTRKDYYKAKISINTRQLYKTSRLVSQLTGLDISVNKPIVGENVFATEAGIHQAALLKNRTTYEIIDPKSVGQKGTRLIMGRHSGKHALADRIKKLGFKLPKAQSEEKIDNIYRRFKEVAVTKKTVEDEDLIYIVKEVLGEARR